MNGHKQGRIDIGLFGDIAPENINNFLHIIAKTYN
jgi:cyclophilin family peptidyl-prolyl cis-trans isomerase